MARHQPVRSLQDAAKTGTTLGHRMSDRRGGRDVIALARELVEHASENPPGDERAVADYLEARLESSPVPFAVESREIEPDRPNVVARAGDPTKGSILLTGHTDVVPASAADWSDDPYELRERNGRLVGRGIADMKGALAAKLVATEAYYEAVNDPGEVVLAFVVDEERNGAGMRALVNAGIGVDAAVIGEPTNLEVCIAQKGVVRYVVTIRGESGHSGRPNDALNAIEGLRRVLECVKALDNRLHEETTHPLLAPETITVTEAKSGIAPNVVPDVATATIDWRFHPGTADPESFDRHLREALASVTVDEMQMDIECLVFARAAEVPTNHEFVTVMRRAAGRAGVTADAVGFEAATDARFLIHDAGIPTVLFGPGSIEHDAHTVDESIAAADLEATVDTYREVLREVLS